MTAARGRGIDCHELTQERAHLVGEIPHKVGQFMVLTYWGQTCTLVPATLQFETTSIR